MKKINSNILGHVFSMKDGIAKITGLGKIQAGAIGTFKAVMRVIGILFLGWVLISISTGHVVFAEGSKFGGWDPVRMRELIEVIRAFLCDVPKMSVTDAMLGLTTIALTFVDLPWIAKVEAIRVAVASLSGAEREAAYQALKYLVPLFCERQFPEHSGLVILAFMVIFPIIIYHYFGAELNRSFFYLLGAIFSFMFILTFIPDHVAYFGEELLKQLTAPHSFYAANNDAIAGVNTLISKFKSLFFSFTFDQDGGHYIKSKDLILLLKETYQLSYDLNIILKQVTKLYLDYNINAEDVSNLKTLVRHVNKDIMEIWIDLERIKLDKNPNLNSGGYDLVTLFTELKKAFLYYYQGDDSSIPIKAWSRLSTTVKKLDFDVNVLLTEIKNLNLRLNESNPDAIPDLIEKIKNGNYDSLKKLKKTTA